jgi:quercetin dioxygenase-like cupin family protein
VISQTLSIAQYSMKIAVLVVIASSDVALSAVSSATTQTDEQKIFSPQEIKWSPTPPSLPSGAEVSLLYGDATKEGLFALRIKVPKGYRVAPHSHPKLEIITMLAGTVRLAWRRRPIQPKRTYSPPTASTPFPGNGALFQCRRGCGGPGQQHGVGGHQLREREDSSPLAAPSVAAISSRVPAPSCYIAPALPALHSATPGGVEWLHEIKFDGWRLQVHKHGASAALFAKNGYAHSGRVHWMTRRPRATARRAFPHHRRMKV